MLLYTHPDDVVKMRYSYDKFNTNVTKNLLLRYKLLYEKNITESIEPRFAIETSYLNDVFLGAEEMINPVKTPKIRNGKQLTIIHMRKGNLGANPFNPSYFIIDLCQRKTSMKKHRNLTRRPMVFCYMTDGTKISKEFPKKIELPLSARVVCTQKEKNNNEYTTWNYSHSSFTLYAKTITVKLGFLKSRFNDK